jgi:NADH-quinone oxidoreductase subunit J
MSAARRPADTTMWYRLSQVNWSDVMGGTMFYVLAGLVALAAIGVVVSRNIVRMAICLMFALVGIAGLYFLLEAEFLAATQLVVYVGGTLIMIVFGVMLTSKSPKAHYEPKRPEAFLAVLIGAVSLVALIGGLLNVVEGGGFVQTPTGPVGNYPMAALGQALLGDYLVPFEVASILLLVVMIGAAYLAKARRRHDASVNRPGR